MALKTRDKLIEVARQLFAYKGVEKTTMSDIATASAKGRRTIYTYFRSKLEIYNAVVEEESEAMVSTLREVAQSRATASQKLREFARKRLAIISPSETPKATPLLFRLDSKRYDKYRRLIVRKQVSIINQILEEGIATGEFDAESARASLPLIVVTIQGLEYQINSSNLDVLPGTREAKQSQVIEFLINAIKSKPLNQLNDETTRR